MKNIYRLILAIIIIALQNSVTYASQVIITTTADSGPGSLRNGVLTAGSGDTIAFSSLLNYHTIILSSGEIVINKNLTISGPGQDKLTLSGNDSSRIFNVSCSYIVSITGLTLNHGKLSSFEEATLGGAIYNCGYLTLTNVLLSDNTVTGSILIQGGAVYNSGTLEMTEVKVLNNAADAYIDGGNGGGIYNAGTATLRKCEVIHNRVSGFFTGSGGIVNTGTMNIYQSTFADNSADGGYGAGTGGIYNSGTMLLSNSTIYGNWASSRGSATGGIGNGGKLTIHNCTITQNGASTQDGHFGSGIASSDSLIIGNTIIAQNGEFPEPGTDGSISGTVTDLGYNLIGVNEGIGFSNPTDLVGTALSPLDPVLGPLQYNGGPTQTAALLSGSPAIDAGDPASTLTYDQRGEIRPNNARIDIGAFESGAGSPTISITSPASGSEFAAPASITIKAAVSNAGEGPFLHITNGNSGYRKLKIGYDSIGIYHGVRNVRAGGNNVLEITLRNPGGPIDWTKLQVRPNGSRINPLALSKYVNRIGGVGNDFVTISIPLSDFDKSIDFSHLVLFELPYSITSAPFTIDIQKIIFTGGSKPFLWFGDKKTDNSFDGTGKPGQLFASLAEPTGSGGVSKVEFYNGSTRIGEDYTTPYEITWKKVPAGNYQITAIAKINNGASVQSPIIYIEVNPASARLFNDIASFDLRSSKISVYPNPVPDKVIISANGEDVIISVSDELGRSVYTQQFIRLTNTEIDLSMLKTGMYILDIQTPDRETIKSVRLFKE